MYVCVYIYIDIYMHISLQNTLVIYHYMTTNMFGKCNYYLILLIFR